mgnify:CR=1 FL=1
MDNHILPSKLKLFKVSQTPHLMPYGKFSLTWMKDLYGTMKDGAQDQPTSEIMKMVLPCTYSCQNLQFQWFQQEKLLLLSGKMNLSVKDREHKLVNPQLKKVPQLTLAINWLILEIKK